MSETLTRYNVGFVHHAGFGAMVEDKTGPFVRYDDAIAALTRAAQARDEFKAAWLAASDVGRKAVGDMGAERIARKAAEDELRAVRARAELRAYRLQKDVNEAATIMAGLMKEHEREHAIAERAEQRAYHAEQKLAAFTVEPLCALRDYKAQRDRADAAEAELRALRARE